MPHLQVLFTFARTQLELGLSVVLDCPFAYKHLYETIMDHAEKVWRMDI